MWLPSSVEEMRLALGSAEESDALDFKRALAANTDKKDLGKDVAAMALYGGVIVIGVDETDGVATQLTPVSLSGTTEQIEQVIASRVTPPLFVEIDVLRETDGDEEGLVVLKIPASTSAPHQADGRYPARAGGTTRSLSEVEVERWYARRSRLQGPVADTTMSEWTAPSGTQGHWGGVGEMKLLVHAPGAGRHPRTPRLKRALERASAVAATRCEELLTNELASPHALSFLRDWSPRGSLGWHAGMSASDFSDARDGVLAAATWTYVGAFSSLTTIGLEIANGGGRCAYEHLWVTNLIAQLLLVGAMMHEVPGAGMTDVSLELSALEGAASYEASRARIAVHDRSSVVADSTYEAHALVPVKQLAHDPRQPVCELLEPLLTSFVDRDTVRFVSR